MLSDFGDWTVVMGKRERELIWGNFCLDDPLPHHEGSCQEVVVRCPGSQSHPNPHCTASRQGNIVLETAQGGIQKTKTGKIASKKYNTLGPPPPVVSVFATPKITPIFFVRKCIYNGQNKFYAWSHVKIFLFSSIIMVHFYHESTIIHGVIQQIANAMKTPDQV